jgi:LysM repeat protein
MPHQAAPPHTSHITIAGKQLEALVRKIGVTMKHCIQLNCPVVYMAMQVNLESGAHT